MTIRIKFLAKTLLEQDPAPWLSLFPAREPVIGTCRFIFDPAQRDYDWLVVYEGLPILPGQLRSNRREKLACARENTLFITTEPASIRIDGPYFLRQYGHVLSAKAPNLIRHPNQIFQTPPLRWFYGRPLGEGDDRYLDVDALSQASPPTKTADLSTVSSRKRMSHTVHRQRFDFVQALKQRLGDDLHVFGRGIAPISDKAEAMDRFRYHIAIENHVEDHHWTEKIMDCFLATCLPFYYGPSNIGDYFPQDAVIPIDIFDLDGAEAIIRNAIARDLYTKRLPAIREARRKVLNQYNMMNVIAGLVCERHVDRPAMQNASIDGRHLFRRAHPLKSARDGLHRLRYRYGQKQPGPA